MFTKIPLKKDWYSGRKTMLIVVPGIIVENMACWIMLLCWFFMTTRKDSRGSRVKTHSLRFEIRETENLINI